MYDDKKSWEKEYFMANNLSFSINIDQKRPLADLVSPY